MKKKLILTAMGLAYLAIFAVVCSHGAVDQSVPEIPVEWYDIEFWVIQFKRLEWLEWVK